MTCQDVIFDYTLLIALCVVKILFTRRHDCAYQWYWFECWRNPESLSRSWAWFEDEFSATRSCLPWMDIEREREREFESWPETQNSFVRMSMILERKRKILERKSIIINELLFPAILLLLWEKRKMTTWSRHIKSKHQSQGVKSCQNSL